MSDNAPHDDRDESNDDRNADDRSESDHWLSSLLSALESLESSGSTSTSGRRRGDRGVFDYDISIRTGDDLSGDETLGDRNPFSGDENRERDGDRSRKRRIRSSGPSSDHHVSTQTYDDELLVTADIAGADPEDVTVGFDDSTLVIAVDGTEIDRVEVPWRATESTAMIKNGVLTVQLRPAAEDARATEDDE